MQVQVQMTTMMTMMMKTPPKRRRRKRQQRTPLYLQALPKKRNLNLKVRQEAGEQFSTGINSVIETAVIQ